MGQSLKGGSGGREAAHLWGIERRELQRPGGPSSPLTLSTPRPPGVSRNRLAKQRDESMSQQVSQI